MGKKEYFVITGDVVGSSLFKGEERKNLHNALVESLQFIKEEYDDNFLYDFDIFRFEELKKRKLAEYILIGTLYSFVFVPIHRDYLTKYLLRVVAR